MNFENLILDRYFGDFFNNGRWPVANEILTADFKFHGGVEIEGIEKYIGFVKSLRAGFPDLALKVEDFFGDGTKFAARFNLTGTQSGVFVGIPPTGKKIEIAGMDLIRVRDGRISEIWGMVNALGMFQQLGAMPGR